MPSSIRQPIMGRYQRELLNKETGVYRYDELIVLRKTRMAAVLLEAGSIINRDEELKMGSPERRDIISSGVAAADEGILRAAMGHARSALTAGPATTSHPLPVRRASSFWLLLDLVEFGKRAFELFVEEPHRIENFAEGRGRFGPVSLSKGEHAVVSQIAP